MIRSTLAAAAAALLLAGCESATASARPAKVEAASSAAPAAQVGTQLPDSAAVRVTDADGKGVRGVAVHWSTDAEGAWISRDAGVTDGDGVARVAWILGRRAGTQVLTAAVDGLAPLRIEARALPGPAARLRPLSGDGQRGTAGGPLPAPVSVRLTDGFGNGIAAAPVHFAVVLGGGSVAQPDGQTDAEGTASPGAWVLGAVAGGNALRAAAPGVDSAEVTAIGLPGAVQRLDLRGDGQRAGAGTALPLRPTARALDANGNSVPGVPVSFAVVEGGGTVGTATAVTDSDGLAHTGGWTLGPVPGTNRLSVSVGGVAGTFTALGVTPTNYDIDLRFLVPTSDRNRQAFADGAARWMRAVRGDVPDVHLRVPADQCFRGQPAMDEWIDDVAIFVVVDSIDGPGNILAATGVCYARQQSWLPLVAVMIMDSADLAVMDQKGWMNDVVTHEMGHALGIGSIWFALGLVGNGTDPQFTGSAASAQYGVLLGTTHAGVPVEDQGGGGTILRHWRERTFGNELMTGYISSAPNPLSAMTIASLQDLGYRVDLSAAEPYALPKAGVQAAGPEPVRIGEMRLNVPLRPVLPDGTVLPPLTP